MSERSDFTGAELPTGAAIAVDDGSVDALPADGAVWLLLNERELDEMAHGELPYDVWLRAKALNEDLIVKLQRNAERPQARRRK